MGGIDFNKGGRLKFDYRKCFGGKKIITLQVGIAFGMIGI